MPCITEPCRLYNEERMIDKSRVTCLAWAPGRGDTFLVSHASGSLYSYQADSQCANIPPQWQYYKGGDSYTVYTAKNKTTKNPVYRISVGVGPINEFVFSPCGAYLALVSQDGWLRVFHLDSLELVASARSYFGGLLCCCWSPDGKYIVLGGEDDLVTVYSFHERRVVVRGQGHRSWVSVVSFDVYNLSYDALPDGLDFSGSDDESGSGRAAINSPSTSQRSGAGPALESGPRQVRGVTEVASPPTPHPAITSSAVTCYRFGSVGQDTLICLWDLTEDVLKQVPGRGRVRQEKRDGGTMSHSNSVTSKDSGLANTDTSSSNHSSGASSSGSTDTGKASSTSSLTHKLASLGLGSKDKERDKEHKRTFSLPGRGGHNKDKNKESSGARIKDSKANKDGSVTNSESGRACGISPSVVMVVFRRLWPGLGWVPQTERDPRAGAGRGEEDRSREVRLRLTPTSLRLLFRLTSLVFKESCLVTACQDGYVCTWARPGASQYEVTASPPLQVRLGPGLEETLTCVQGTVGCVGTGGSGTVV